MPVRALTTAHTMPRRKGRSFVCGQFTDKCTQDVQDLHVHADIRHTRSIYPSIPNETAPSMRCVAARVLKVDDSVPSCR